MNTIRMVNRIEALDNKRCKIYTEQSEVFVLYKGEISQYKIQEQKAIPESVYQMIQTDILPKRAKKRCLNLLKVRPYTEYKLREKLKEGYYSSNIIDEAIEYVKSFHYIDDYDLACQYIFYNKERESRKKIEEKLLQKGISKDILEQAFRDSYQSEEECLEMEYTQAYKLLEKKHYDAGRMDWKEKQKIYAFLMRKGIRTAVIRKVMALKEEEEVI